MVEVLATEGEVMAKKQVYQVHHIQYEQEGPQPEWTVRVTRGEHFLITQLQRFKSLTEGAVKAILYELSTKARRKDEAEEDV